MRQQSTLQEPYVLTLPCVRVSQPIGEFFIASIDSAELIQITFADVRKMVENDVDEYLGIQRTVNPKRVRDIGAYVNTVDACFPSAVILAIPGRCARYDEATRSLVLTSDLDAEDGNTINKLEIARVLDGQHRIEGLQHLAPGHPPFEVNVSIFIEMDIESQAYLFSMVNLQQTKVSKSLVYDLFGYSKARSPQRTAHNIAVALDQTESSPFYKRIKRLGVATKGRFTETLTQAAFVEALLKYISPNPVKDRDISLRGRTPPAATADELHKLVFRNMFLEQRDMEIADLLFAYFSAAAERWPRAWNAGGDGNMLPKTNGFKALMRLFRPAYLYIARPGEPVTKEQFARLFAKSKLSDDDFNITNFPPGTGGETGLFKSLYADMGLQS